jgi:hypothetical protein
LVTGSRGRPMAFAAEEPAVQMSHTAPASADETSRLGHSCRMADVHWTDRYAVDGMFIREMLLIERNEVTDECVQISDSAPGCQSGRARP